MSAEPLSDGAECALRMVAACDARNSPICVRELGAEDLNELCAAGIVELTIRDDVYVTLSPAGRLRAGELTR